MTAARTGNERGSRTETDRATLTQSVTLNDIWRILLPCLQITWQYLGETAPQRVSSDDGSDSGHGHSEEDDGERLGSRFHNIRHYAVPPPPAPPRLGPYGAQCTQL